MGGRQRAPPLFSLSLLSLALFLSLFLLLKQPSTHDHPWAGPPNRGPPSIPPLATTSHLTAERPTSPASEHTTLPADAAYYRRGNNRKPAAHQPRLPHLPPHAPHPPGASHGTNNGSDHGATRGRGLHGHFPKLQHHHRQFWCIIIR